MDNKQLFIDGYLNRISEQFNVNKDTAFEIFAIAAIIERPFQEVYDDIQIRQKIGDEDNLKGKDGGIDGAVFVEQGGYYTLMVFQCKNSRSLKPNQLDKFRHDVDDLFRYGIVKPHTELLQPKINEYQQLSRDGFIIEIKYYFVYSGSNDDPNYAANIQNYRAYHQPNEYEIWDSGAIYEKISQLIKAQAKRKDIKFIFNPQTSNIITSDRQGQGLYTYSVGNVRAANFRIEANELCRLVEQELAANNTYEFLFSDNIRSFLGFKVRPNQRMKETLTNPDSAIYFPLLNNGITIICERMEIPSTLQSGKYILPAHNPIIVNGLQTTRVIYEVFKEIKRKGVDGLQNVFVNVRLYETSNTEILEKITDATNTQTPISYKDKVSNKDFNLYAKEVFANHGIAYITKRGEVFSNNLSKQLKSTIESDTLLRFWYATFYEQPETAKNSVYEVMEAIFDATNNDSHPLHKLFSGEKDSPIYSQLIYSYKIYRYVQSKKESQQALKEYISHATELLAYGIYKHLENDLTSINNVDKLEESYQVALDIIDQIIKEQIDLYTQREKSFSYSGYFRKAKCRFEYNIKATIIDDDSIIEKLLKI
ncbi:MULTISPECIES: AIPR family protein [Pseudanabaena]|uniref:Abortive phage infection protein n=2 Tax=Pseudanabaena TaxID=1152 RepID=L8N5J2_9CYAN|nr:MULTISPECIES: AIPR family protein [Pseudanabaena]ELS33493.1 Abortive phage infection protein [Pseudanabaena biceps PCC 7429]MDG3494301.1 AIPR family protein [Pseudanabaena catenata USMAC16]